MDPISVGVGIAIVLALGGTAAGGVVVGRFWEKKVQDGDDESIRIAELEAELATAKSNADHYKNHLESKTDQVQRLTGQRDQYREIAESHTVTIELPEEAEVVTRDVWTDRVYRHHPRENLRSLAEDLAQFEGKEVILTLDLRGRGGWRSHLEKRWYRTNAHGRKFPISEITGFTFEGPPMRVLEEIKCLLLDDDTGLTQPVSIQKGVDPDKFDRIVADAHDEIITGSKKAGHTLAKRLKMWRDSDSPLLMEVDLQVREVIEPPPPPTVVEVPVAVVQEEVVERIIEKPVVVSIPAGMEPDLCGHTREEIAALVDAHLEVHAALQEPDRVMGSLVTPEVEAAAEAEAKRRIAQARSRLKT